MYMYIYMRMVGVLGPQKKTKNKKKADRKPSIDTPASKSMILYVANMSWNLVIYYVYQMDASVGMTSLFLAHKSLSLGQSIS